MPPFIGIYFAIRIGAAAAFAAPENQTSSAFSEAAVRGEIGAVRAQLAAAQATAARSPMEIETHRFGIFDLIFRTQGVAMSGSEFWWSGRTSLSKSRSPFGPLGRTVTVAIPDELRGRGCNHIGDIDFAGGKIYASIEDGPHYEKGFIGVYDAETLAFEKAYSLPRALQPDGVPWVAVDAESRRVFSSEFESAEHINAYDLDTMAPLPPIRLSSPVHRVQGAKVLRGIMYMTSDVDHDKAVFAVDLASGRVEKIVALSDDAGELEGLALREESDALDIYVLSVAETDHRFSILSKRPLVTRLRIAKP